MRKKVIIIVILLGILLNGCSDKKIKLINDETDTTVQRAYATSTNESTQIDDSTYQIVKNEFDMISKSNEELYSDGITSFQNGEFERAQQLFINLGDFQDSYLYRQYLNLLIRVQNNNYIFYEGTSIGNTIHIDGLNMYVDENKYLLRAIKKFNHYFLTTALPDSSDEELCIEGDRGQINITKMQFKNGDISIFKSEIDSIYATEDRKENDKERQKMIGELQEKAKTSNNYGIYNIKEVKTDPLIGMTDEEVINSTWGKPEKINKTTYAWGITEQWCYKDNRYIYFDNGNVTAIQE